MNLKLEEIKNLYEKYDKNKNIFDDSMKIIDFFTKEYDKYTINIKLQKYNDEYSVFLSIEEFNKLILNVMIKKLEENNLNYFDNLKNDLVNNDFNEIINKYYMPIKQELMK